MQWAWATDIHLDHLEAEAVAAFCRQLAATEADGFCLTGDLSEAPLLRAHLEQIAEAVQRPVYFVLGNHDYYHGSLKAVRAEMTTLSAEHPWLRWLPATGLVPLSPHSCLIGHDSWGDGRNGDVQNTWVKLKDFRLIAELAAAGEAGRVALLQALGDEAADFLRPLLQQALTDYAHTLLLMHPPPLREACLYGSEMADDNWAPHFTCKAVGDVLKDLLPQYPEREVTVLAGHTHNACDIRPLPNLRVCVGGASYGKPEVAGFFRLP
ncbi:MAG: metallophosphoesterase family protein [Candidatus Sericytochromatia bacterium]